MSFDVETYVRDNLDAVRDSGGAEMNATCPFCDKPSHFYINKDTGNYCCFKCDARGRRGIGVIAKVEGISYAEASRFLMKEAVKFRRKETLRSLVERLAAMRGGEVEDERVDIPLPAEFKPVFKNGKFSYPSYLRERGVKRETAKVWGLGWARRGRYAGRIIIPVVCPNGRSLTARDTTGEQEPRYLNPKGADHGRLLLGWEHVKTTEDAVLVEGPLDAIKCWQSGLRGYALMGKMLHMEQLRLLFRRTPDAAITVMLDPEEAEAPYRIAQQLLCKFENVYVAQLPAGTDPGDATKRQLRAAYDAAKPYGGERNEILSRLVESSGKRLSENYQ